jgi:hypothetical protein
MSSLSTQSQIDPSALDDVEQQAYELDRRNGYASAATMIATDLDNETFIFRRFDELGARNLLYLQTELLMLEDELKKLDAEVVNHRDPDHFDLKDAQRDWRKLLRQCDRGNERFVKRRRVVKELREKIKVYRKHN